MLLLLNHLFVVFFNQREASPLSLDEGSTVSVVTHEGGGMSLVAITLHGKNKSAIEFKAWDIMNSLGFRTKEITVEDSQKNTVNDGKFK